MSVAVEASFTFHKLINRLSAPAKRNARPRPITPSPASSLPKPVWQADRLTISARRRRRMISGTWSTPSWRESTQGEHDSGAQRLLLIVIAVGGEVEKAVLIELLA